LSLDDCAAQIDIRRGDDARVRFARMTVADQLTATKRPSLRGEFAWMAWARTSLPVPLSPVRRMVASLV
jgi:hypothetical protein